MAVIQISKIQIRRGKANSGTGLPQLASGEFGWAVDTQELYIGNGSVSEGAPAVGNTRVLTENDAQKIENLLDAISTLSALSLSQSYEYRPDLVADLKLSTGIPTSTTRFLQARLDDTVSVRSFGVKGDGVTDDTGSIQLAITQMYLNPLIRENSNDVAWRVVLNFEPGIYVISGPLLVPPFAIIRGAGKDKTIIRQLFDGPVIKTINGSTNNLYDGNALVYTDATNQPREIEISNLTLENYGNQACLSLQATKNSKFSNIKFKGNWNVDSTATFETGVELVAASTLITCENNIFDSCDFINLKNAVDSKYDIRHNIFTNCHFEQVESGVRFGVGSSGGTGQEYGPRNCKVSNSIFKDIDLIGYHVAKGVGNMSYANTYIQVGNDGGPNTLASNAAIVFTTAGNISDNDFFDRAYELNDSQNEVDKYYGEVSGAVIGGHKFNNTVTISTTIPALPFIKLPGNTSATYVIHYLYKVGTSLMRRGELTLIINSSDATVLVTDEFNVSTANIAIEGALYFDAKFIDTNADSTYETVLVTYTNNALAGTVHYWYELLS